VRAGDRKPITYADAGVDITRTTEALERVKPLIRSTFTPAVAADVGSFGAMFSLAEYAQGDSLLVTSVDSVGTKVMVAAMMDKHDTVGQCLVNHCVNDILVQGARPLLFMDYIAADTLPYDLIAGLIEGLSIACKAAGCALIGGEMAELPGMYQPGQYDLVGFVAGIVSRSKAITSERVAPGDIVLGIASSGLHTNGYSLARKVLFETAGLTPDQTVTELGETVGEALLKVHRCYAPAVLPLLDRFDIKGMAHITGGGLPDNLVRALPEGCRAVLDRTTWTVPPIFTLIQQLGNVPEDDLYRTFNMGVGYCVIVSPEQAESVAAALTASGETVWQIGRIESGERGVVIG
jgi:phosphoribosylformylglycinamidine cyclo-ligase